MTDLALGSIFTASLGDAAATLVAFTGLFSGAAHYNAVLAGFAQSESERATAMGFFFGFILGAVALLADSVS
jgi:hypothetical protein